MSLDRILNLIPALLEGMGMTLLLFFLVLIISIPLGVVVAMGKMSKHKWISVPVNIYILIMRGTPLMLQIIAIYFSPMFFKDMGLEFSLDRFLTVIIAFSINYAAYFAEIFRGGIQSIDKGQYEASKVLGLNKTQTFFKIILPQTVKRVLPASANEVITLVKDTSLAQIISVSEMFGVAKKHTTSSGSLVPIFVAGIFYFVFNWLVTITFNYIEKKLNYYK